MKRIFIHLSLTGMISLGLATNLMAAPTQIRVVWDGDASSEAVIGFTTNSTSGNQVKYMVGSSGWKTVTTTGQSLGTLNSQFVRLTGLAANSAVYFKACDSSGCTGYYRFRTANSSASPITFIMGGDSRTNSDIRRQGNRLVANIRPLFVMFGGDYTQNSNDVEMGEWLTDWEMAYPKDSITTKSTANGVTTTKQESVLNAIPIMPTIGNHEDGQMLILCKTFGVDADRDGKCTLRDTYYTATIGGNFLRTYTMNTQLRLSGYSSDWDAQKTWLKNDLSGTGSKATWRIAQYHVPMFPLTSSKPQSNSPIFGWASYFYDYKMNLIEESDSHLTKYTKVVKPGKDTMVASTAGTVYLGEGAWGAPTRTADRSYDWIEAKDSFAHFNVIQLDKDTLQVKTVKFTSDGQASQIGWDERGKDGQKLPTGLVLWEHVKGKTSNQYKRDSNGRTQVK